MGRSTAIVGTGSFVPEKVLTNFDLEKMVDTSDEWIKVRTGIRGRHIVDEKTATSDLAVKAAERALEQAKISPSEIDLIIVATVMPDMSFPSTACLVQDRIGAKKIAAFDLSAACSGFVYSLAVAHQFIKNGVYETALVIGTETLSKITDWTDRNTCVLMGDGAGAVVLRPTDEGRGILSFCLGADGKAGDLLKLPAGGSRLPATHETIDKGLHYIKLRGSELFKIAVRVLARAGEEALSQCGLSSKDVRLFIPHQANLRIMQAAAEKAGIPLSRLYSNIDKYGNTSAASIAIALDEAYRGGKIKEGDIILLDAFGGGLTWGACVIRW
ncbi:ketoacyl-ACP synthase III [candidate division NPL-UPA2 bacterium]|nr:ketoacyl-ACP synthase III [candidate division NPL-UPA2 bacterium]